MIQYRVDSSEMACNKMSFVAVIGAHIKWYSQRNTYSKPVRYQGMQSLSVAPKGRQIKQQKKKRERNLLNKYVQSPALRTSRYRMQRFCVFTELPLVWFLNAGLLRQRSTSFLPRHASEVSPENTVVQWPLRAYRKTQQRSRQLSMR